MFDGQELIERFQALIREDASDTRRRKLIHAYYRQITLEDVDPDRSIYERSLRAGHKVLIRYLKDNIQILVPILLILYAASFPLPPAAVRTSLPSSPHAAFF